MKRTGFQRRQTGPVGRRAAARRAAGGKVAVGRASVSREALGALRRHVFARALGWCEACQTKPVQELEHAKPRSGGGADHPDNVWGTCRLCHRLKEAAYTEGRLRVTPLGKERFRWERLWGKDKWTVDRVEFVRETPLPPATSKSGGF